MSGCGAGGVVVGGVPACFGSGDQLLRWRRWNAVTGEAVPVCADCTEGFRHRMLEAGRCQAGVWRHVVFGPRMAVRCAIPFPEGGQEVMR